MSNRHRSHWGGGIGIAAAAAAMIGMAGAPTAQADDLSTDIGFLTTAETDLNDGLTALSQLPGAGGGTPPAELGDLISQYEAIQTPLLSSDNGFVSGFGELLFNGPDQQLAQSAESFLSAADAYAAEPTSLINTADLLSATFQWTDSLLFDSVPANAIGKLTDFVLGDNITSASAAADMATSASSATGNQYDPAVFDYSADPSNLFSPAYLIQPVGPEDVTVTDASGDVFGTQDFSVSTFGIPVDNFTGHVEYSPVSSPLDLFGNPYVEDINVAGTPGTLLPENTGFLITEFGSGYGNVLEEAMNSAGTSATVGDFILTPFGDENITPIVDLFLPPGITDAVDPSSFADLLSSIGL